MLTTDLAERAGVKISTIRFYERAGLLPEVGRSSNGYRDYTGEHVRRIRFLRRGQELGFTLSELGAFASLSGDGGALSSDVTTHAIQKISEIDRRIADLERTRDALKSVIARDCPDPNATCPVVDALAG